MKGQTGDLTLKHDFSTPKAHVHNRIVCPHLSRHESEPLGHASPLVPEAFSQHFPTSSGALRASFCRRSPAPNTGAKRLRSLRAGEHLLASRDKAKATRGRHEPPSRCPRGGLSASGSQRASRPPPPGSPAPAAVRRGPAHEGPPRERRRAEHSARVTAAPEPRPGRAGPEVSTRRPGRRRPRDRPESPPHSQDAGAGGAHEAAHRHVGVGGAALVAVEALAVGREAAHLPQQLQVLLLLLPLGARGHGPAGEGTARHGAGPRSHPNGGGAPGPGRPAGEEPGAGRGGGAGEGRGGRGGEGNRRPPLNRGGSAAVTHAGWRHRERRRKGGGGVRGRRKERPGGAWPRAAARKRPAAAPGPGRLNDDESRRNLRDTFMRSGKEMAATERRGRAYSTAAAPPVGWEDALHPASDPDRGGGLAPLAGLRYPA